MTNDLIGHVPAKGNARSSGYARNSHDWYCESASAVDALLDVETFVGVALAPHEVRFRRNITHWIMAERGARRSLPEG